MLDNEAFYSSLMHGTNMEIAYEMKGVHSAVRTGSSNKAVWASSFRTNSDLCHLQHKLIGFYNLDEKRLQRGTDWVFK